MRLLLIEDNGRLAALVRDALEAACFAVDHFVTLADAEVVLATTNYDAMILDLGLPDGDGLRLVRELRRRGWRVPILILTARDALDDRVTGLDAGADDYLPKPFAMQELIARIGVLLRRPGGAMGASLEAGDLVLDTVAQAVSVAGRPVAMTRREVEALEVLMRRAGRVVSRATFEAALYGQADDTASNSIEAVVSRLRRRLVAAGAHVAIHTVRGVGYLLKEERETCAGSLDRSRSSSFSA